MKHAARQITAEVSEWDSSEGRRTQCGWEDPGRITADHSLEPLEVRCGGTPYARVQRKGAVNQESHIWQNNFSKMKVR